MIALFIVLVPINGAESYIKAGNFGIVRIFACFEHTNCVKIRTYGKICPR